MVSEDCFCQENNEIKIGEVEVTVTINGLSSEKLDNTAVIGITSQLFSEPMENIEIKLSRNGNVFSGTLPLELKNEIGGFIVSTPDTQWGIHSAFRQSEPLYVTVEVDSIGNYISSTSSYKDDFTPYEYNDIADAYMRFYGDHTPMASKSSYDSWENVREYELKEMLPKMLKESVVASKIPDSAWPWLYNLLKCRFAAIQILPYVKAAERYLHIDVAEPPIEAYSFLNEIDYSDTLLTHLPFSGVRSFLYALLRFPDGGFGAIGDTPVAEWQQMTREKLAKVVENPTPLILDLLAAMSYIEQIEVKETPLTQTQIDNIQSGFNDDLDKIILAKNEAMCQKLQAPLSVADLSSQDFNLIEYINSNFPGKAVLVDRWITWCGPCLTAISRVNMLKSELPHNGAIVFLYISDTSSDVRKSEDISRGIDGVSLRISKEENERLGEEFGLEAFPSYLLFDRDHKLVSVATGFPGETKYKEWIKQLAE